jgi:hypothetical protein
LLFNASRVSIRSDFLEQLEALFNEHEMLANATQLVNSSKLTTHGQCVAHQNRFSSFNLLTICGLAFDTFHIIVGPSVSNRTSGGKASGRGKKYRESLFGSRNIEGMWAY